MTGRVTENKVEISKKLNKNKSLYPSRLLVVLFVISSLLPGLAHLLNSVKRGADLKQGTSKFRRMSMHLSELYCQYSK